MAPEPKERLVDPETGETPPLSPQRTTSLSLFPDWTAFERELAAHLEPDDAA